MDSRQLQPLLPRNRDNARNSFRRGNLDGTSFRGFQRREEWIKGCSGESARQVLGNQPTGVLVHRRSDIMCDIELVEKADIHKIIWPWNPYYRIWCHLTALGAILTIFLAPYQIAFGEASAFSFRDVGTDFDIALTLLFIIDIIINFNLAIYKDEQILFERRQIAEEYFRGMFWVDFVGVFPFLGVALSYAGVLDASGETSFLASAPLMLFSFARLHHMKKFSDELRNDAKISLLSFTLFRNFAVVFILCHFQACVMYYLARLHDYDDNTWLGPSIRSETHAGRYITSLYLSITTFCTVGYGDFSPVNPAEKIAGCFFMLINIMIASWIIGSMTLLMLKGDEETREYRESLEVLHQYGSMHGFEQPLLNELKEQLHLQFNNRNVADEQVLKQFPSAVRRKIIRRLYKDHLVKTPIMTGVRSHFVDAFLTSCTVEIFSPGEEIVERGCKSDLFLLVDGLAEIHTYSHPPKLQAGDMIGEVNFFTESPQVASVISLTVCKTLTMTRSVYRQLAKDHPGSAGKILQNLVAKVESMSMQAQKPKIVEVADSNSDIDGGYKSMDRASLMSEPSLSAVKDSVSMHMRKHLDDETTRLLFAASRGDTRTISRMCEYGFDPNNADYDHRTALMVASTKGNTNVAKLLLQYNACVNTTDIHGSSAMLDATKHGHDDIMDLLLHNGANLHMSENQAASCLCQAVHDGDILLLKRLLKAGIDVNAADYDKCTAAHVAAAEGNVAAIRILFETGADLTLPDRWGNTVEDESRAHQHLSFLRDHKKDQPNVHEEIL